MFTPLCAKGVFTRAMNHLRVSTSMETRNYPFKDRCSRLVEVKETITLPKGIDTDNILLPKDEKVKSSSVTFQGGYDIEGNTIVFEQKASFGKRVYDADEWTPFRKAVDAQKKFAAENIIINVEQK